MVTLLLSALALQPLRADWPHLRGPNYDGVSTESQLAAAWPADGPPRLWSRELGQGYSGFIVAGGKVFTQCQTMAGQTLLCLDPDNGATIWETRYDWAWQSKGAYPGPYASPTWYGGKVYYASPTGIVGCVDAATGAAVWSLNVRERFHGKGSDFGYAATPLVEDGKVILPVGGPDAGLVALDAESGRTIWTAGSDLASYCPAFPITFQGRRFVVGYLQNAVVIVDLVTGALVHRQQLSAGYDEHSAWPLYKEPHLLLASPFRMPAAMLKLERGTDHALLCRPQWTSRELSNDIVSSVLHAGHVYGFDLRQLQASRHRHSRGTFRCIDWTTGKSCWSADSVGQASVLVADGKLILTNDAGELIVARADPSAYDELARWALFEGEICWTPPTLWQGRLFVRSPSRALCVHLGRPESLLHPATSKASPIRASWHVDSAWLLTHERDYPNDALSWEELSLWFGASVALTVAAALAGWSVRLLGWRSGGSYAMWGSIFIVGLLGPNALSALAGRCLFTWPLSVYAALHGALLACWWAEQNPSLRHARWLARLAVVGFLLAAYAYFELCRAVGMFIGWAFLFGLLPGFPFALFAARAEIKGDRWWLVALLSLAGFAAFFWSGQGLLLWKAVPIP